MTLCNSKIRYRGFIISKIEVEDEKEGEVFTYWETVIRREGSPKILAVVENVAEARNRINEIIASDPFLDGNEEGGPA